MVRKLTSNGIWLFIALVFVNYDVIICQLSTTSLAADSHQVALNATTGNDIKNTYDVPRKTDNGNKKRPETNNRAPPETGNSFQMPPFIIGGGCVLVIYGFFHCLYVHCYTEKRVQTIATRTMAAPTLARAPTIIVHDDPNNTTGEQLCIMSSVRVTSSAGKW